MLFVYKDGIQNFKMGQFFKIARLVRLHIYSRVEPFNNIVRLLKIF